MAGDSDKSHVPRRLVPINRTFDFPILKIEADPFTGSKINLYAHLFKESDLGPTRHVLLYLGRGHTGAGLDCYVGGDLVLSPLFVKIGRAYSEVNLLAVGSQKKVSNVVIGLMEAEKAGISPFDYRAFSRDIKFSVENVKKEDLYFRWEDTQRFLLKVAAPLNSRASPIDLILMVQERFDEYVAARTGAHKRSSS